MRQSESEDILLKTEELLTPAGKDRKKRNDQSISGRHAINLNLLPLLSNPSWAGQDSTTHPRRKHSLTALPPKDIISSWSFSLYFLQSADELSGTKSAFAVVRVADTKKTFRLGERKLSRLPLSEEASPIQGMPSFVCCHSVHFMIYLTT